MPIEFSCGTCGKKLRAPDTAAGKRVKCPGCGGPVPVPGEQIYEAEDVSVPAAADDPAVPDDEPDDEGYDEGPERPERRRKKKKRQRPTAPGIALVAVGALGFIVVLANLILQLAAPAPQIQFQGPN